MANSLLWKDLSADQIEEYFSLQLKDECLEFLSFHFNLKTDERSLVIRDMYYYALEFAKKNDFHEEQTSVLFSILKETHQNVISAPDINFPRDFGHFKRLLLHHSVNRPPYSEKIFTQKEMLMITDYITDTYFRHYLLYKYTFTKKMRLEFMIENFMPEPVVDEVPPIDGAIKPSQSDSPVTEQSPTATTAVEQQEILESVTTAIVTEEPKEIDVETMIEPQLTLQPQKSAKHEAALAELKNFITTVLSGKLEEIKASITQRITEKDEKVTVPGHEAKTSHDQKPKVEEEKKKAPVKGKK